LPKIVTDCVMLYVGDALTMILFAGGMAWAIEAIVARNFARIFVEVSQRQLTRFLYAQLAIVLLALVGFKFVVLSGGPGVITTRILSAGTFTRDFSLLSVGLVFTLATVGLWRWSLAFKKWFVLRWFK